MHCDIKLENVMLVQDASGEMTTKLTGMPADSRFLPVAACMMCTVDDVDTVILVAVHGVYGCYTCVLLVRLWVRYSDGI